MKANLEVWRNQNSEIYVIHEDSKNGYKTLDNAARLFSFPDDGKHYPSDILQERFHLSEATLKNWPEEISVRDGYKIQVVPNGEKPGDFPYEWKITDPSGKIHRDPTSWNDLRTALEQGMHAVTSIYIHSNTKQLTKEDEMIQKLQEVIRTILDYPKPDIKELSENPEQLFTMTIQGRHVAEAMEALNQADALLESKKSPGIVVSTTNIPNLS